VKPEHAGKKIRCPGCQAPLTVPELDDESEDEEVAEESPPRKGKSGKGKSKSRPRGNGQNTLLLKLWPLGLLALPLLVGLVSPMGGAGLGVFIFVGGLILLLYGFFVGLGVTAASDPGRTARSLFSPLASQMFMTDAERKKLRKVSSAYLSAMGRGVLLMLIGGLCTKLCFDWQTEALARKNQQNMPPREELLSDDVKEQMNQSMVESQRIMEQQMSFHRPSAPQGVPQEAGGANPPLSDSEKPNPYETSPVVGGETVSNAPTAGTGGPMPGFPERPRGPFPGSGSAGRERRAFLGGSDRPSVGAIVVTEIDGGWQPMWVKQHLSNDQVVVQKMVTIDGKVKADPNSLTLSVQELRVPLPEDVPVPR
jgi:hypothetical protein